MTFHAARRTAGWAILLATMLLAGCEVGVEQQPPSDAAVSNSGHVEESPATMMPVAPHEIGRAHV